MLAKPGGGVCPTSCSYPAKALSTDRCRAEGIELLYGSPVCGYWLPSATHQYNGTTTITRFRGLWSRIRITLILITSHSGVLPRSLSTKTLTAAAAWLTVESGLKRHLSLLTIRTSLGHSPQSSLNCFELYCLFCKVFLILTVRSVNRRDYDSSMPSETL